MKTTKVFAALMLASVVLVIICAIVSLTDTVAIVTGVVGSQEGSGISVIALLFGLIAVAMFAFAYKRAIWNWMIRTGMIVVGLIIFLASIAGLTENWNLRPGGGERFTWSAGGGEIVRTVYDSFLWIDFDVVHFLMLLGSFGILATAIWGAFRWEKAKSNERTEDQMRTVLDELPPAAFSPEANLRLELEQHFQNAPNPATAQGQNAPSVQPSQTAAGSDLRASFPSHSAIHGRQQSRIAGIRWEDTPLSQMLSAALSGNAGLSQLRGRRLTFHRVLQAESGQR